MTRVTWKSCCLDSIWLWTIMLKVFLLFSISYYSMTFFFLFAPVSLGCFLSAFFLKLIPHQPHKSVISLVSVLTIPPSLFIKFPCFSLVIFFINYTLYITVYVNNSCVPLQTFHLYTRVSSTCLLPKSEPGDISVVFLIILISSALKSSWSYLLKISWLLMSFIFHLHCYHWILFTFTWTTIVNFPTPV